MGKRKYKLVFLAVMVLLHTEQAKAEVLPLPITQQDQQDDVILGLWINGVDQGQDAVLMISDHKKYIECPILKNSFMDLNKFQQIMKSEIAYCLLSENDIQIEQDIDAQLLKIKIPTHYMQSQNIENSALQIPSLPGLGGFLNYNVFYQSGDYSEQANATTDIGIFWKNTFFNSNHIFRKNYLQDEQNFQSHTRLNTSLTFEFPKKFTTLQLGDNVSTPTGITQSYYFGGFRWGTNYTSRPDFVYWNTPSFQGSALVPSTVDLIINGNKAYNTKINPGEFNLNNHINFRGLGQAEMIVEDIMGNKTVQNIPIFVNERLLKKGLNDYSLSAGKLRYNFSEDSDDYREWFGSAYFRRGVTEKTTLGSVLDVSKDLKSVGLLWSQYLYKLGLFELNSAYSDSKKGEGYTVSTEFKRDTEKYSVGIKSQYYSDDFNMLGMEDNLNGQGYYFPERENLVYISKSNIPVLGNLSLSYVEQKYRPIAERDDKKIFSIRSSRNLFENLNMSLGVSYETGSEKDHRVDLSLSYRFNDKHSAYYNQTDNDSSNLTIIRNTSNAVGVDYAVGAGRVHGENTGNISTRIKTKAADLDLQYLQTGDSQRYSANLMGAVAWLGNSFGLSKLVNNGFSLVKITESPNIDVYRNDLFIGKTNKNGEIFIHDLIPYTNQHLSFNENQLEIENKVETARKTIMPLNKRGYIVDFPVVHTREVSFKLVNEKGELLPQGSQIIVDQNQDDIYPISSDYIVTLYGLTHDIHILDIKVSENESCKAYLDLKNNENTIQPLTLICK
ncbi:fimbrial biogenesis outer membrane usher protein [Acinetobacter sp. R933-2]|uniref:fimbria/pilus outer membrane usher protein n=1 Tax=Acinetobacter sp. R933-2 TaxID=2746728 RepID=UPI00257715AD|nr:fimbria/pilus outer membrane usher protein [Acinetobacter sp. R933-2]MDM1247296.1 fimbrial biogenesis outer membrane usher protein [Acinetobacter sp. R933-2]